LTVVVKNLMEIHHHHHHWWTVARIYS
jgi:hypothetical protein